MPWTILEYGVEISKHLNCEEVFSVPRPNPKRIWSIQNRLESLCASDVPLKDSAQRVRHFIIVEENQILFIDFHWISRIPLSMSYKSIILEHILIYKYIVVVVSDLQFMFSVRIILKEKLHWSDLLISGKHQLMHSECTSTNIVQMCEKVEKL